METEMLSDRTSQMKFIVNAINDMTVFQHLEILKIIVKNNCVYTENANGIFVDINTFEDATLQIIYEYILFCNKVDNRFESQRTIFEMKKNAFDNSKHVQYDYEKHKKNILDIKKTVVPAASGAGGGKIVFSKTEKAILTNLNQL